MSDTAHTPRVSEMPAQHPAAPETAAQSRARFFNSGNAFDVKLPEVPDMAFVDEPATALNPETDTGVIDCDISEQLECAFPATSGDRSGLALYKPDLQRSRRRYGDTRIA